MNDMKLTEIRIDRTKSLGNYENLKMGFTVTVEESESEKDAVERAVLFLDWEINKSERDATYAKYQKLLAVDEGDLNGKREGYEKWVETYKTRRAEMEVFTF